MTNNDEAMRMERAEMFRTERAEIADAIKETKKDGYPRLDEVLDNLKKLFIKLDILKFFPYQSEDERDCELTDRAMIVAVPCGLYDIVLAFIDHPDDPEAKNNYDTCVLSTAEEMREEVYEG